MPSIDDLLTTTLKPEDPVIDPTRLALNFLLLSVSSMIPGDNYRTEADSLECKIPMAIMHHSLICHKNALEALAKSPYAGLVESKEVDYVTIGKTLEALRKDLEKILDKKPQPE